MNQHDHKYTKIIVTVNGKRVGRELLIDNTTYLPVEVAASPVSFEVVAAHETASN